MEENKNVTREKREEVRRLKEKRSELKTKLEKFTNYGNDEPKMPLQTILQYTLDFASSNCNGNNNNLQHPPQASDCNMPSPNPIPAPTVTMHPVPSSVMQVDSPCPSPKLTPATSINNLAGEDTMADTNSNKEEMPMDVEMGGDDLEQTVKQDQAASETVVAPVQGCDMKGEGVNDGPCPKNISDVEYRVLQVWYFCI